jgi:hypothetical protein
VTINGRSGTLRWGARPQLLARPLRLAERDPFAFESTASKRIRRSRAIGWYVGIRIESSSLVCGAPSAGADVFRAICKNFGSV